MQSAIHGAPCRQNSRQALLRGIRKGGYTGIKDDAGRYTLDEVALYIPNMDSPNQDGMEFIHENLAPDYSPACSWDYKLKHQLKKAEARIEELEAERDEADRRAGAAERRLAQLKESEFKRDNWIRERKLELGYSAHVSFDRVWEELVERANLNQET